MKRFLGKPAYAVYNLFACVLMLLVGVVFIYTPGDLFITHILGSESKLDNPVLWIVYGVIFVYYIIATMLPIDKIIGRIYPVFGAMLIHARLTWGGMAISIYTAAGCSHAKPPSELWVVRNAANGSTAPRTGRRAGVSTQRRCHVVGVMRPAHMGMYRKAAAGIPATVSVIDFP